MRKELKKLYLNPFKVSHIYLDIWDEENEFRDLVDKLHSLVKRLLQEIPKACGNQRDHVDLSTLIPTFLNDPLSDINHLAYPIYEPLDQEVVIDSATPFPKFWDQCQRWLNYAGGPYCQKRTIADIEETTIVQWNNFMAQQKQVVSAAGTLLVKHDHDGIPGTVALSPIYFPCGFTRLPSEWQAQLPVDCLGRSWLHRILDSSYPNSRLTERHHRLEQMISERGDLNCQNVLGQTPLMSAIVCNNLRVVQILLDNNANPDQEDVCGLTPLHYAAAMGHKSCCEVLLQNSTLSLNKQEENFHLTPLMLAFLHKQAQSMERLFAEERLLLPMASSICWLFDKDPPHEFNHDNQILILSGLVQNMPDFHFGKANGLRFSLQIAVCSQNSQQLQKLGALPIVYDGWDEGFHDLLETAVQDNFVEGVRYFCKHPNIDINRPVNDIEETILMYAIRINPHRSIETGNEKWLKIITIILDTPGINLNLYNEDGRSALDYARVLGLPDIARAIEVLMVQHQHGVSFPVTVVGHQGAEHIGWADQRLHHPNMEDASFED
ncbi:ankyrin [Aaosphaeria arxii CBS 175.79]|uniref:Ankyrin n=1 Tax=Aaosphaeria arxii CBS 175.79 TaxID=1450172 RepID=A0A6A5XRK5_9PLEO|nr:ankyrin [Aaosphaeria arxii CBS 175.79]KAF2015563.1 ankyrin [Aaosphaeria arxii CBS 175.79]